MRIREQVLFGELRSELALRSAAKALPGCLYERPATAGGQPLPGPSRDVGVDHELSELRSRILCFQVSTERSREDPGTSTFAFARSQNQVASLLAQWDGFSVRWHCDESIICVCVCVCSVCLCIFVVVVVVVVVLSQISMFSCVRWTRSVEN